MLVSPNFSSKLRMEGTMDAAAIDLADQGDIYSDKPVTIVSANIHRVSSVLKSFVGEKRRLVRWIGFGGLLRVGVRESLDDHFSLWLLRIMDPDNMTLRTSRATVIGVSPLDVHISMGIPYKGRDIEVESDAGEDVMQAVRHKLSLVKVEDSITLEYLEQILLRDYGDVMSHKDEEAFKIAVVLYTMSTLLAIRTVRPTLHLPLLKYVVDTANINLVNWAGYVIGVIREAALTVQQAIAHGSSFVEITGCPLCLQIIYIDNLDFGESLLLHSNVPRVSAYPQHVLKKFIAADLDVALEGRFLEYGISKARRDADVIYSRRASGNAEIHTKVGEIFYGNVSSYAAAVSKKCIKDLEDDVMPLAVEKNIIGDSGGGSWDFQGQQSENLDGVIARLPVITVQPELSPYVCVAGSDASLVARCNPRKRMKSCAVKPRKKAKTVSYPGGSMSSDGGDPDHDTGFLKQAQNKDFVDPENSVVTWKEKCFPGHQPETMAAFCPGGIMCSHGGDPDHDTGFVKQGQNKDFVDPENYLVMWKEKCFHGQQSGHTGHGEAGESPFIPDTARAEARYSYLEIPTADPSEPQNNVDSATSSNMAMVLYDPIVAAERCPSTFPLLDHCMAPKKVSEQPDYTDVPFSPEFFHKVPQRKKSRALYKIIEAGPTLECDRVWFRHKTPWLIEISGRGLISQFRRGGAFEEDLSDGILRTFTELDDEMFGPARKRFRHYLPVKFASTVLSGGDYLRSKHIRDAFVGDHLKYDVEHCRHILAPVRTCTGYSCYIWDISARDLLVIDPTMMNGCEVRATSRHKQNMDILCNALVKCTQTFFDGWKLEDGEWFQGVQTTGISGRCRWNNSALYTMHYARWYAGMLLEKRITDVELGDIRADMFYQLLHMAGNVGDVPSLFWRLK